MVAILGVIKPCTCIYTRTLFWHPTVVRSLTHSVILAFEHKSGFKNNYRVRNGFGLENRPAYNSGTNSWHSLTNHRNLRTFRCKNSVFLVEPFRTSPPNMLHANMKLLHWRLVRKKHLAPGWIRVVWGPWLKLRKGAFGMYIYINKCI